MQNNLDFNFLYKNREEAYQELFDLIPKEIDYNHEWKIITTTINNIPQVCKISEKLRLECEPFFTEEIYAPNNKECTIACVSELKEIVIEKHLLQSFEINEDFVYDMAENLYNKTILTKLYAFKMGNIIQNIKNKNIMIFSDGCETGLNTLCTIKSLLANGVKKIFLFTPVISANLYEGFDMIVDNIFANHIIEDFINISYYYENFSEVNVDYIRHVIEQRRDIEQ